MRRRNAERFTISKDTLPSDICETIALEGGGTLFYVWSVEVVEFPDDGFLPFRKIVFNPMNDEFKPHLVESMLSQSYGPNDSYHAAHRSYNMWFMTQTTPLVTKYKSIRADFLRRVRSAGYFIKYLSSMDALGMPVVLVSKLPC